MRLLVVEVCLGILSAKGNTSSFQEHLGLKHDFECLELILVGLEEISLVKQSLRWTNSSFPFLTELAVLILSQRLTSA